ncbi:MAG: class I SAM-dependent methyltransferase [Burkholderiaceae bacterium]
MTTACLNCGNAENTPYAHENGYPLVKCRHCGLLYVATPPAPAQIEQAHQQGMHRGEQDIDVTGRFSRHAQRQHERRLRALFGDDPPRGTWLDVGCGHGELLVALNNLYGDALQTVGSEPNAKKRASAQARGLNVSFIDLDNCTSPVETVSLINVYSHLPAPRAFLATLHGLINEGGRLLLRTGDSADLAAEDHYRPFYLPDHLSFANERIIRAMLVETGFEIIAVRKYPFCDLGPTWLAKEFAKLFVPGYRSLLGQIFQCRKWRQADMLVLARKPVRKPFRAPHGQ